MSVTKKAILTVFLVLLVDQTVKFIVKTNMMLGQEIKVFGDWFIIHFTENDGMAFGWDLPGEFGKLALTLFRIIAVIGIAFYIRYLIRQQAHQGLIICIALILAGAIGNIIDSVFYGVIFNDSFYNVATLFPDEPYGTLMHGHVVDMFYVPIIKTTYPDWFPFVGGNNLVFFRPVFNIADSAISVGVIIILIFQKRFFHGLT
ncbi:MAG: lipoprotein signal peptidase [Bacteroidota bacterium]